MTMRGAIAAVLFVGCTNALGPAPVTRLEIHAVPTIVAACDEGLDTWTVRVFETGEQYTSPCDAPIVLTVLQPYEPYTLEISGYASERLCWSGKCAVTPLPGLGVAECVNDVIDECAGK